ncbi:hypothetical protein HNO88_000016 [Novosphingobium chloroacetimidivorans]|uniref:DUF1206 domain-containing protein n=1 Tax=Novosphingobium chloroacetimidivorans TaxID=1428314 RepID=A0A7W7K6P3_9SPHN|nr:DUF1206 domain-containing protein [Novosphingobium chloroacetimidivorans]MBB4856719.1 hypothetical protein [Novosphingobium chloroacetimidivorans]
MVDKSEKIVWLARLGYAVRGLVYLLLGYLALSATGQDEARNGTTGALEYVRSIPGGTAILYISALGLIGYAVYKLIVGLFDTENIGSDAKGIAKRVAYVISAIVYAALSWTAIQLARGATQAGTNQNQELAATALTFDLGPVAVGLAGLALLIGAGAQAKSAYDRSFMRHIASDAPPATCWIGRIGLATRALVFLLMGWSLLRSAWFSSSEEVRSLGQALLGLREMGLGFSIIAAGIALFGVFSLITSRYRIIPDPDPKLNVRSPLRRT